jgi:hypothetical protein
MWIYVRKKSLTHKIKKTTVANDYSYIALTASYRVSLQLRKESVNELKKQIIVM